MASKGFRAGEMDPTFAAQQAPAEMTGNDLEAWKVDTQPATRGFVARMLEVVADECASSLKTERNRIAALEAKASRLVTTATLNAHLEKALRATGVEIGEALEPILDRLERLEQLAGAGAAPVVKGFDCGQWKQTSTYGPPAMVSHRGRRWIAIRQTSAEPGSAGAEITGWRLSND